MRNEDEQIRQEQSDEEKERELRREKRMTTGSLPANIPLRETPREKETDRESQEEKQESSQPESDSASEPRLAQILRRQREKALSSEKIRQAREQLAGLDKTKDIYKGIKQVVRVIKLVTGGAGSCGEIFASAPSFILVAHAEWAYSKFLNPKYKIAWWEKALVIIVDVIILLIFIFIFVLVSIIVFLIQSPWETVQEMGFGPLKALWTALRGGL